MVTERCEKCRWFGHHPDSCDYGIKHEEQTGVYEHRGCRADINCWRYQTISRGRKRKETADSFRKRLGKEAQVAKKQRKARTAKYDQKHLRMLYDKGMDDKQIAAAVECSIDWVRRWRLDNKLESHSLRPSGTARPVECRKFGTKEWIRYPSAFVAAKTIGCPTSNIYKCLNGTKKTAYGYDWRRVDE